MDTLKRGTVARFAAAFRELEQPLAQIPSMVAQNVFENILKALVADTDNYLLIQIDSTFCKVHQHAAGAPKNMATKQLKNYQNSCLSLKTFN